MKFLKKIICFFLFLFALLCAFILLCAFNPNITETIANFLYPNQAKEATFVVAPSDMQSVSNSPSEISSDSPLEPTASTVTKELTSDYIAPDQATLIIPNDVSGKTGYQQVNDTGEQLATDEATALKNGLTTGSTGDGLTFDPLFYPYYAMLSEPQKNLYRQIYANANDLYPIFLPLESVTPSSLKDIFSAVYNDHPELFWLETAYAYKYTTAGECIAIELFFNDTAQNLDTAKATFQNNANQIVSAAQSLSTSYEKEKFVHDTLLDKISYHIDAPMNQSAYSALVNNQTVCAGYARAFQYLLQQLSIPTYYCTGYAGESHAWNISLLDGEYYNVDTTWDDTGNGTYDYFNKTDDDYSSTHLRQDLSIYLPPCNGEAFRNLEPIPVPANKRRSLSDIGISQDQVLTTLDDYYKYCYSQIVENGTGNYTFHTVVNEYALLEECIQSYESNAYIDGYMKSAAVKIGATVWEILYGVEELEQGQYLISHDASLK